MCSTWICGHLDIVIWVALSTIAALDMPWLPWFQSFSLSVLEA